MNILLYNFMVPGSDGSYSVGMLVLLFILILWDFIWKAVAMWKAARTGHFIWFVCILVFNTGGMLPLVYLIWFDKSKKQIRKK